MYFDYAVHNEVNWEYCDNAKDIGIIICYLKYYKSSKNQ